MVLIANSWLMPPERIELSTPGWPSYVTSSKCFTRPVLYRWAKEASFNCVIHLKTFKNRACFKFGKNWQTRLKSPVFKTVVERDELFKNTLVWFLQNFCWLCRDPDSNRGYFGLAVRLFHIEGSSPLDYHGSTLQAKWLSEYFVLVKLEESINGTWQARSGPVAQRITRLPTEQKIPGSNPGRIASL